MVLKGCGDYLGQEMTGGGILAQSCRDYAFRNMRGGWGGQRRRGQLRGLGNQLGKILIRGSSGERTGWMMRGGRITILNDCGDYLGILMSGGEIVVFGNAGRRAGWRMKGGTISASKFGEECGAETVGGTILRRDPEIWDTARRNWHWPQLPRPKAGKVGSNGEFPFQNYDLTLTRDELRHGSLYLESLFEHLIVHYIFCPRSMETAGALALSAVRGLKDPALAKTMVNIFTDIVVDSFRLERSCEDEEKVVLAWSLIAEQELGARDMAVLGFSQNTGGFLSWTATCLRWTSSCRRFLRESGTGACGQGSASRQRGFSKVWALVGWEKGQSGQLRS
jgi:hypothetical protein